MNNTTISKTYVANLAYVSNGLETSTLVYGKNVSDYQIISFPLDLDNKDIIGTLENDLGVYNDEEWRLFHYQDGQNVELGEDVKIHEYVLLGVIPTQSPINPPHQGNLIIGNDSTIRSHTTIYLGNKIGENFQTGHGVMIRENNVIGNNVSIGTHSVIERENIIEDGVRIHSNCFIPAVSRLAIVCGIKETSTRERVS